MSSSAPVTEDYVVELLSEHGKRRALIGCSSNADAIYECYDYALRAYPHTTVRMRQGKQTTGFVFRTRTCTRHKDSGGGTEAEAPPEPARVSEGLLTTALQSRGLR
jgi:hypothetical protein